MLPKENRLKKALIKEVLKKGKIATSRHVFLKFLFASGQTKSFGFIIPSKSVKKAVVRNKLKRRAKFAVFELLPWIKNGCLVVIFLKKGAADMEFLGLKNEIELLLKNKGMISCRRP